MDSSFHNAVIFTEHKRNIMEAKKKKKKGIGAQDRIEGKGRGWKVFLRSYFIFLLLRATSASYGSSQVRGRIRAAAAGLHHSHSNVESEPHLQPATKAHGNARSFNPLSKARDQTCVLMDTSLIHFHCATMGTGNCYFRNTFRHILAVRTTMTLYHGLGALL